MKNIFVIIVVSVILISCGSSVKVLKVNNGLPVQHNQQKILTLPQTVFKITFELEKKYHYAGPYASYANKLLGLTEVVTNDYTSWELMDVKLSAHSKADTAYTYFVSSKSISLSEQIKDLMAKGMLYDPSLIDYSQFTSEYIDATIIKNGETDLSIKSFLKEKNDTLYKVVMRDSIFVRLPVYRNQLVEKSLEEKAREAADMILKIRARRLDIISFDEDIDFSNESLQTILDEMERLESKYLSLFTGTVQTQRIKKSIWYTPAVTDFEQSVSLCSFNELSGFSEEKGNITIRLNSLSVPLQSSPSVVELKNALPIRVPVKVQMEIFMGAQPIASAQTFISQTGSVLLIPVK